MTYEIANTTLEIDGLYFKIDIEPDEGSGRPWEECDGHGPVREIQNREDKRAGERILQLGNRGCYSWAYDWQGAMEQAKQDGWGLSDKPDDWDTLTKPQQCELAVQQDFDFLKAWCEDDWVWSRIHVIRMAYADYDEAILSLLKGQTPDLVETDDDDYLGSVEFWQNYDVLDKKNAYAMETAREMAGSLAQAFRKEQTEAQYWAERGAVTV